MARRKRIRLTDAGIARLRPREREYTVRDKSVPGLGVRVRPSGGKSYVLLRKEAGLHRRFTLGPTMLKSIVEVRRDLQEAKPNGKSAKKTRRQRPVPILRDFVAGAWKEAHFDRYKPSTQKGVRFQLERRILPTFGSKRLDRISPTAVRRWFDRKSRTAPGSANHGLGLLRRIMNFAVACGHVKADPTRGIRLNRGAKLSRFLSREEIARLHRVLDEHALKGRQQQADIIRLLLLTGCRKGEILNLRWSEVDGDTLLFSDGKTGPRQVPLNAPARRILERQPRGGSAFVFPSPRDPAGGPRNGDLRLWYRVRREAVIEDCRLHDLRHTHASQAVMSGVPVPVVSRLLGHSNVSTTFRYAHLGDRDIEAAAERIGQYIGSIMGV